MEQLVETSKALTKTSAEEVRDYGKVRDLVGIPSGFLLVFNCDLLCDCAAVCDGHRGR